MRLSGILRPRAQWTSSLTPSMSIRSRCVSSTTLRWIHTPGVRSHAWYSSLPDRGAQRFGWDKRAPTPRSMRDGRYLIGQGVAAAIYTHWRWPSKARVTLRRDGSALVESGMHEIGGGTYTVMQQVAADRSDWPRTESMSIWAIRACRVEPRDQIGNDGKRRRLRPARSDSAARQGDCARAHWPGRAVRGRIAARM